MRRRMTCEGVMSCEWQSFSKASFRAGSIRTVSLAVLFSMSGLDVNQIIIAFLDQHAAPAASAPARRVCPRVRAHSSLTTPFPHHGLVGDAVLFEVLADQLTHHLG